MILLITYVFIALGFSFLCSIAESVILSVTTPYVRLMEREGHKAGSLLRKLKSDINAPLAAILTLNTVAHTAGAAGAGAQAAAVFGNEYLGIASAILTLLILVFLKLFPRHWEPCTGANWPLAPLMYCAAWSGYSTRL
ncbi:DUF21 domain-containing protein [Microbulbifer sp. MKSA007]|nr:DUF21 domain-containing protein [Microbulbifer sp. MKSA007]